MPAIGISPLSIDLVTSLDLGPAHSETVQVNLSEKGVLPKIDVYFLADTTGSMQSVIDQVSHGAENIMRQLTQAAEKVGADVFFGVGNYRDLNDPQDQWFDHQVSLTSEPDRAREAISRWSANGGGTDIAEGQFYALDILAQPPGGSVGWRPDSKRIIVWIGDAPGHDPICTAIPGVDHEITQESVTAKLQQQGIFVLAISTPSGYAPGLNADPKPLSKSDAYKNCRIGGEEGQATKMAGATGGTFDDGIKPEQVVQTIIDRSTDRIRKIGAIKLVPDQRIAPFVRVQPPTRGPIEGGTAQPVLFTLSFPAAAPSKAPAPSSGAAPVTVEGRIDVKIDGVTTGSIPVKIAVPDLSGHYTIQCTKSGLNLQLETPSWKGDGANVVQNISTGIPAEQWDVKPVERGGYRIKNRDTALDRYLEVANQSDADNAEILTRKNPDGEHKEWLLVPVGASDTFGPVFRIQNRKTGKVLDVLGQSKEPRVRVVQYRYWGDYPTYQQEHNQHWYLRHVD
ncbi:RICIN domain-containing protein [Streptomyces rimosus]|uniref:RICIN domain-containing protein n=1 Tax=Streptomyces rimosus TaxID=1927 RepID=UPI00099BD201|nr:RICIN domain-containing protein [Streptomyces rimosus]